MAEQAKQVLVVDDDEPCRVLAKRILSRNGYSVDMACDGFEGLEIASTKQYDLILMDVMMPDMDGFEVCKKIKDVSANVDTPIIMVSALDSINDMAKANEAGAMWYVSKPYDMKYLVSVVNHRVTS